MSAQQVLEKHLVDYKSIGVIPAWLYLEKHLGMAMQLQLLSEEKIIINLKTVL